MRIVNIILLILLLCVLTGCTATQKGMVIGALGGGVSGGAIGYFAEKDEKTENAVTGAAIGAVTGAVAGAIIGYFAEE